MAPPNPPFPAYQRRQAASSASAVTPSATVSGALPGTSAPPNNLECGMACIRLGDTSDCDDDQTQACLCKSGKYALSVNSCLSSRCTPADAKAGSDYSYGACLFLGVNVSTVAIPSATASIDLSTPPVVYAQTFVNVQAIMSSICAALLFLSLVLGFFACRSRARIESQSQQGSWTNMATQASRTGHGGGKSFGGVSRGNNHGLHSGFDPTATFASASYPLPNKRGTGTGAGLGMASGMERSRGFTNRLTLDEADEEWEMGDKSTRKRGEESGSGSASSFVSSSGKEEMDLKAKDGEISPVTFTTEGQGRSRAGSEVELEGSTIHLARLDRGAGGRGAGGFGRI